MNSTLVIATFLGFLGMFTGVGVLSSRQASSTSSDYLVASRSINPWFTGLSAVSTNHSGFMFIGLIGFTYLFGVQAVWLMLGWFLGDLLSWVYVHRRVREASEAYDANSFPALLGTKRDLSTDRTMTVLAGVMTFVFLGGYAAAQLNAGSVTLNVLFGWPMWSGAVIGTVIVVLYCFSGGLRASIWTDAAQAVVMVVAMAALVGSCVLRAGGPVALWQALAEIDPQLLAWVPDDLTFGFGLYLLGFTAGGFGVIGQPHVMIRFMAISSAKKIRTAGAVYFVWYAVFTIVSILVGLYSRVLLPELTAGVAPAEAAQAAELAMPTLATELLPDALIGLTLAGLFSATMSTADSQLLSCSAAITQDVAPRWKTNYVASKIATLAVAALALVIALTAGEGVFSLVLSAWSALGAAFGPVLLVRLSRSRLPTTVGVAMMLSGAVTVFAWGASSYSGAVFKLLPGMMVPILLYVIYRTLDRSDEERPVGVS